MSNNLKFNAEVFSGTVGDSTKPLYSLSQHNAMLGSAGSLIVQILLDAVGKAATTVTVELERSNTNEASDWKSTGNSQLVTAVLTTDAPTSEFMTTSQLTDSASFLRFKITCNQTGATVRIVASGRD